MRLHVEFAQIKLGYVRFVGKLLRYHKTSVNYLLIFFWFQGAIAAQGTYDDLQKQNIDFVSILTSADRDEDLERKASTLSIPKVCASAFVLYLYA